MSAPARRRAHAPAALLARVRGAWLITAALAVCYLIAAPPSADLAAAGYRAELFSRAGLTLWDNAWYGGHHLLAYSLLAPALSAALGAQLLAALSMTAAAALFSTLVRTRFHGRTANLATSWFAFGAGVNLFANRVPFDLGLALGLGALVLAGRSPTGRARSGARAASPVAAALCALASPVAGAFLALAAGAWALAGGRGVRPRALSLLLAALTPIALLQLAFPESGSQPFVGSAFYPALAGVLVLAVLIPPRERVVLAGTLMYAAVLVGAFLIPSSVGGNADRLGAILSGPIAACMLAGADRRSAGGSAGAHGRARLAIAPPADLRSVALIVLAPFLAYWQVNAAVADFAAGANDPAERASYYAPLLRELGALGVGFGARPARIEVVATRNHAEARFVGAHVMLARGWERQLDRRRNALFYDDAPALAPERYRAWLAREAIALVALPDAELDYSARSEAALVRAQTAATGLREVWRSSHWRLFAVAQPTPLAQAPAVLEAVTADSFTVSASRAGTFEVRIRFTPYWALAAGHGCVSRAADGFTNARTNAAGRLHIIISFDITRMFDNGQRCR